MTYLQKKKLAFMSIVNQVKGFVRSISGTLPLTLEGCVNEESITNYKIYGQSVQDGEPTPNNPVEVESVGEKTSNLINWDYLLDETNIIKVDNGYYSEVRTHTFDVSSNIVKQLKSVLKPDTTYTLSRIGYAINGSNSIGMIAIRFNGFAAVAIGNGQGLKSKTFSLTQEQIDNIIDLRIFFHIDGEGATISEIQLTESDTVLPYEPYGKYKIPITVNGTTLIESNFANCNLGAYSATNQKNGTTDLRNGIIMTDNDVALSTGYTIKNGSKYESISEADIVDDGGTKVLRLNTFLGSDYDHVDNTKYPVVKSDEALPIKGKIRIDLEVKTTKGAAFWLYHTSTTDGGNYRLWKLESGGTKATRLKVFDNTNTGKAVSCDVYNTYTIIMDNTAGTAEFYLNGISIYTGTLPKIPSSSNWQLYFKQANDATLVSTVIRDSNNNKKIESVTDPQYIYVKSFKVAITDENMMEEYESTTTNIFLDEPLRKVGDYADYIDFKNGKVIRRIGKTVIDSSINFYYSGYSTNNESAVFFYPVNAGNANSEDNVLSNYFPTVEKDGCRIWRATSASNTAHFIKATNEILGIDETDTTNDLKLNKIKAWLNTQNAVKPVLLYYVLKNPTETSINLPIIPTHKGINVVSVDIDIQPSDTEIKYYSNVKE